MSNCIPFPFKKSLIVAAILSLSACSTTPRQDDYDLSRVGDGILKAGRTTADVSSKVWNKTTYLLGFSDDDGTNTADDAQLLDTTHAAATTAAQEDAALLSPDTTIHPIVIRRSAPIEQTQLSQSTISSPRAGGTQTTSDDVQHVNEGARETVNNTTPVPPARIQDLVHAVAPEETLWDIAKITTGDANNWHVLADVNNLGPGASVFPGQQLIIPADMIKIDSNLVVASSSQPTADITYVNTQDLTRTNTTPRQPSAVNPEPTLAESPVSISATAPSLSETVASEAFELKAGETLWNFAKRTTGDAMNWQTIASVNGFSMEQAAVVRAGQTIFVPENLIQASEPIDSQSGNQPVNAIASSDTVVVSAPATYTAEDQATAQNTLQEALNSESMSPSNTMAAASTNEQNFEQQPLASTTIEAEPEPEPQTIKIVEATYKSSDIAQPIIADATTAAPVNSDNSTPAEIMVSGTYYPKAIYNDADFSSSLLMRVSPGTTLQVSKAMGSWFQVKTNKGLGYVHQRDIK